MLKTKIMRYFLMIVTAIVASSIGYYFGFESAKQTQIENALTNHLLCNLASYEALQKGDPELAKDNLRVYLAGDVKTYDFYRSEVPDFGNKNEHLQEFIKQARAVQDQK